VHIGEYKGAAVQLHTFLALEPEGHAWSNSCPSCLTHYPVNTRMGGPSDGLDDLEYRKIFFPQLRIAPSILSHQYYTQPIQKRPFGNEFGNSKCSNRHNM
jgi:hypothetical protein